MRQMLEQEREVLASPYTSVHLEIMSGEPSSLSSLPCSEFGSLMAHGAGPG